MFHELLRSAAARTPFHGEVCRLLLGRMSDALLDDYKKDKRFSPLHYSIVIGRVAATDFFAINLDKGYLITSNYLGISILLHAAITRHQSLEVCRILLEHGANPNQVGSGGVTPLFGAVLSNNADAARILLQHGANPNHLRQVVCNRGWIVDYPPIRSAIIQGYLMILSLLLQHGAVLNNFEVLFELLCDPDKDRDTKLEVCRILLMNVITGSIPTIISTLDSLQAAIIDLINNGENEGLAILLEAGIPPSFRNNQAFHHAILAKNQEACRLLLVHGANPFDERDGDDDDDDDDDNQQDHPTVLNEINCHPSNRVNWSSVHGGPGPFPFHTAARQDDTCMFEQLWELWFDRFDEENGGVNDMDEYAIHAICRDEHVSLSAVKLLLIDGFAEHALVKHNGIYPYQIAALNGASLDVVFTLFQHAVANINDLLHGAS